MEPLVPYAASTSQTHLFQKLAQQHSWFCIFPRAFSLSFRRCTCPSKIEKRLRLGTQESRLGCRRGMIWLYLEIGSGGGIRHQLLKLTLGKIVFRLIKILLRRQTSPLLCFLANFVSMCKTS